MIFLGLGDLAVRVVHVAESDRIRRTSRLTSRYDLAITDLTAVFFSLDPGHRDSLRTVRTFLHDAAAADRHFRITHQLVLRRVPILIKEEVETSDLIRTVVRAITCSDTAVVNHVVKALGTVNRSMHRTHNLARSLFALLT